VKLVVGHAVLLVAALAFAYQTWTRGDGPPPAPESVLLWSADPDDVLGVVYEGPNVRTVFEPREDEAGPYVWVTATFRRSGADGAPAGDSVVAFVGDAQADALVAALAAPRAVRDLGLVDSEQKSELGLDDSEERLTVDLDGESHALQIGGVVYASGDRYVEMVEDGRIYVITARDINGLQNGSSILVERRVVHASPERLAEVTLRTGTRTRTMRKAPGTPDAPPAWTSPDAPDRVDESFGTFLERLERLSINRYVPGLDPASLRELAQVEYLDDEGELLQRLTLLRSPDGTDAEYYVLSDRTRVPAQVFRDGAAPLDEDLAQLF
jgi:hypothetical protein